MVTPLKAPARGRQKGDDDLDILLESESETEDQAFLDQENESISYFTCEIWKEFAGREFDLVLGKTCRSSDNMRLNAKVFISIEYPIRPPLFRLSISGECCSDWAIEAEVNLHILEIVPLEYEDYTLSHQMRCLKITTKMHLCFFIRWR